MSSSVTSCDSTTVTSSLAACCDEDSIVVDGSMDIAGRFDMSHGVWVPEIVSGLVRLHVCIR